MCSWAFETFHTPVFAPLLHLAEHHMSTFGRMFPLKESFYELEKSLFLTWFLVLFPARPCKKHSYWRNANRFARTRQEKIMSHLKDTSQALFWFLLQWILNHIYFKTVLAYFCFCRMVIPRITKPSELSIK